MTGAPRDAAPASPGGAPFPGGGAFEALVDFFDDARATPLHARLAAACHDAAAAAPPGPLLDVGCGAGELVRLAVAAGRSACGIDLSPGMCRRARRIVPEARFAVARFEALPFADASFAALTAMLVLHLSDAPRALAEAARVLRPGGILALVTQSTAWSEALARRLVEERGVVGPEREFYLGSARSGEANRRYAAEELAATLAAHGFGAVRVDSECAGGFLIAAGRRAG
jgi:ubiquinone/menaquinone biosynthesis C-methylase UbiE